MDLRRVAQLNLYLLRSADNPNFRFYGQFTDIPNTTRVSNFNEARRLLRVKPGCKIRPRTNILDPNDGVFLVADHGDQFLQGTDLFTHHKLFKMEPDKASVIRSSGKSIDPVTKEHKNIPAFKIADIYIGHEIRSTSSDSLDSSVLRQQIITGFELEPDDIIEIHGNKAIVEVVHDALGVTVAHIKYQ